VWVTQPRGLPLPYKSKRLHEIKKIYVVDTGFGFVKTKDADGHRLLTEDQAEGYLQKQEARYQGMAALLEQELTRVGFATVKDMHDADAELVGILRPPVSPTEMDQRYSYKLTLTMNGYLTDFFEWKGKLWGTDFTMSRKMAMDESDKNAA